MYVINDHQVGSEDLAIIYKKLLRMLPEDLADELCKDIEKYGDECYGAGELNGSAPYC